MKKKRTIVLFIVLVLFLCTINFCNAESAMNKVIESWYGSNLDDVINHLGYPTKEKTIAGRHLYFWESSRSRVYTSTGSYLKYCDRILETDANNTIIKGQWKGNSCPYTYTSAKRWVNPNNNYWKDKKEAKEAKKATKAQILESKKNENP